MTIFHEGSHFIVRSEKGDFTGTPRKVFGDGDPEEDISLISLEAGYFFESIIAGINNY
jgi:hypothetical protein